MPYSVLDDGFHGHPKIIRGGPIVEIIQLRAIAHCSRYLTDGLIELAILPQLLHGLERLEIDGTAAQDIDWPAELLKVGLWERHDRGYRIHDYTQYNRTREQVEYIKAQRQASGSRGGEASAEARASKYGSANPRANASPLASQLEALASHREPNREANAGEAREAKREALHYTTRNELHVKFSGSGSEGGSGGNNEQPEPTPDQIKALIRRTTEQLSRSTSTQPQHPQSTDTPTDEPPPF